MQNDILVCVKMLFAVKIQSHTMADFLNFCFLKARCWLQSFEELTTTEKQDAGFKALKS